MEELQEAAEEVYNVLGSGYTESVYHSALERELSERGVPFSSEGTIPIFYKDSPVGRRRPDIFIDGDYGTIIVELKANNRKGKGQILQYLDLLDNDQNFDIAGGVLIQFGDDLEYIEKDVS